MSDCLHDDIGDTGSVRLLTGRIGIYFGADPNTARIGRVNRYDSPYRRAWIRSYLGLTLGCLCYCLLDLKCQSITR